MEILCLNFHLLQMKSRGLTPSDVTFTSLFNACAESPWPLTDGISRLHKLHSQLKEKEIVVNQITQHAMIKAFAKCGDLPVAFDLFKELLDSGVKLKSQSFAFLLFACAGDKECGLMYAIEVGTLVDSHCSFLACLINIISPKTPFSPQTIILSLGCEESFTACKKTHLMPQTQKNTTLLLS